MKTTLPLLGALWVAGCGGECEYHDLDICRERPVEVQYNTSDFRTGAEHCLGPVFLHRPQANINNGPDGGVLAHMPDAGALIEPPAVIDGECRSHLPDPGEVCVYFHATRNGRTTGDGGLWGRFENGAIRNHPDAPAGVEHPSEEGDVVFNKFFFRTDGRQGCEPRLVNGEEEEITLNTPCTADWCLVALTGQATVDQFGSTIYRYTDDAGECRTEYGSFDAVEVCDDGVENNCDGRLDFADPQCEHIAPPDIGTPPDATLPTDASPPEDAGVPDAGPDALPPDMGPPPDCQPGTTRPCYTGPAGTQDVGICRGGTQFCTAEETWDRVCNGQVLPTAGELCVPNQMDDDCNGVVDGPELDRFGESCTVGVGACQQMGAYICDANGVMVCSAEPLPPQAESCNSVDDDCDGTTDEGLLNACGGCGDAPDEVCDGEDNDCDGAIDEADPRRGENCVVPGAHGICADGRRECVDGEIVCAPEAVAGEDVCNGLDDDCDGMTDNQAGSPGPLTEECYDGPAGTRGRGVCVGGTSVCEGGRFGPCEGQILPNAEVCDEADNDCDGQVDNLAGGGSCDCEPGARQACFTGNPNARGVGACRDGSQVCNNEGTAWGPCQGETLPAAETCDGVDNDCNGAVDNVAGVGEPCSTGVGACQEAGNRVCDVPGRRLVCNAVAGQPAAEQCNNEDDDCDGDTDEGFRLGDPCSTGVSQCRRDGVRQCNAGGQAVCSAVAGMPGVETCNGLDDNCNGAVDDVQGLGQGCTAGVGACQEAGVRVCQAGSPNLVCNAQPGAPRAEVCNSQDDDCDGTTDEGLGLGQACSAGVGACRRNGQQQCNLNGMVVCSAVPGQPGVEICNGLDDDCNGENDNVAGLGEACSAGVGECEDEGVQRCDVGRQELACDAVEGQPEPDTCPGGVGNGRDDDCNGIVDDGEGCEACPQGRVLVGLNDNVVPRPPVVDVLCVDEHEVTCAEYHACVLAGQCPRPTNPQQEPGNISYDAYRTCVDDPDCPPEERASLGQIPVNFLSPAEMAGYCEFAEGRIPTCDELEAIASGGDDRRFPWSPDPNAVLPANVCNVAVVAGCGGGPAPVCSLAEAPRGLCDLAGNMWEQCTLGDGRAAIRFGGWTVNIPADERFLTVAEPATAFVRRWRSVGFRCVSQVGGPIDP